ncbi:hypothetical protein KKC91_03000, partial [bacterium]|nr:hypothetical protein [bacterium]
SAHFKEQGYKTEIEKNLNSKFLDVGIETEKGIIAIEIAISSEHEKENIRKDIEAGCEKVIIACKDNAVLEKVENIIKEAGNENKTKVKTCLLTEIMKLSLADLV